MSELTALERRAIDSALTGNEAWKRQLRDQVKQLGVRERQNTGAGFFTYFTRPMNCSKADVPAEASSIPLEAYAKHPAISGGSFFLLWLKDGYIDFLEGAIGPEWSGTETDFDFVSSRDELAS